MKGVSPTLITILISATGILNPGCQSKKSAQEISNAIQTGDIIVSNLNTDAVLLFNSDGKFKDIIFEVSNVNGESIYGISESPLTNEILIAVDGTPDRVMAIQKSDLSTREYIRDPNLTGNIRGITIMASGNTLVTETNNVELFDIVGYRVTAASWPKALQTAATGLDATSDGGFVLCSSTTDVVRLYDASGAQTATVSSEITGTTDAMDCKVSPADGGIVATWSGTTDTIRKYSPDLSTALWSYSSPSVLSNPTGLAVRANGNVLALDATLNHVVEIEFNGTTPVGTILGTHSNDINNMMSTPQFIWVAK